MAHLIRSKKIDLITVVTELGLTPPENATKPQLTDLIVKSDDYDEDLVKNLLAGLVSDREENEKQLQLKETENRDFEFKKLELQAKSNINISPPTAKNNLLKVMSKYENSGDIGVYLNLFQRQISRIGLDKNEWV